MKALERATAWRAAPDALARWWRTSPLGDYYRAQTPRDQWVLLGVGMLLLLAVFVVLVWRPLHDWRSANEDRYERGAELLGYMRANQDRVQLGVQSGGAQSLLTIVGDVARDQQLQLSRFQPEAQGGVTVVMDDEEFDKIVRFIDVLEREHQLALRQVTIDKRAPGRASARLVIE